MNLVPGNIGRAVLVRVVLAWAVLSVVAATAAMVLEVRRVDRTVVALATAESRRFVEHIAAIGPRHAAELERQAAEFLRGDFVSVRLYGLDKVKMLEAVDPGAAAPPLTDHVHDLQPGTEGHHHLSWGSGTILMQVLVPVLRPDGVPQGYFEGVYAVGAAALADIGAGVAASLGMTLGVVLVTATVLYSVISALNRGLVRLSSDLLTSNLELMETLGSAVALRDSATDAHNYRVTAYAIAMGEALRLSPRRARDLIAGAFLHDAGKVGIADAVLLKPGPLTAEETQAMRRHVALGATIVANSGWLQGAREVVQYHHERFDGTGYLEGLAGRAIPLAARIFAIVDVFDALTSPRPYKAASSFDDARDVLEQGRGTHFDPALLDLFLDIAPRAYREVCRENEDVLRRRVRAEVRRHFRLAEARPPA